MARINAMLAESSNAKPLVESLNADAKRLHPGLGFCGGERHDLSHLPEAMVQYVVSLLHEQPIPPPDVALNVWRDFLFCLNPHWIIPLLYFKIKNLPEDYAPPEEITRQMRQAFLRSQARALQMDVQLGEIMEALRQAGVRVVVLKGPALARTVYPHIATRPSSDLDLLVAPEMVPTARSILERLGYTCLDRKYDFAKHFYCEERFMSQVNTQSRRMIELHWFLYPVFRPRIEASIRDLIDRAVTIAAGPVTFDVLHPVDALMHQAIVNWAHHDRDLRLIWLSDLTLLAQHLTEPDDWNLLQERSVAWSARLALELSLRLAQAWIGLQIPSGFDDFSTWPAPTSNERDMWIKVTQRHRRLLLHISQYWRGFANPGKLLRGLLHLLFPDPALMRLEFQPAEGWRLSVAYVRRWGTWLRKILPR
jgi:hypothetical protein